MIASPTTWDQAHTRFYRDDGAMNAATALAAEDTDITGTEIAVDTNMRLRLVMAETSATGTLGRTGGSIQLQYNHSAAPAWNSVTGASNVVRASASKQFADGDACTRKLTQTGSNSLVDGKSDENDGVSIASILPVADQDIECEFCFQIRSADVSDTDTIDFRILHSGFILDAYTTVPRYTVSIVAASGSNDRLMTMGVS